MVDQARVIIQSNQTTDHVTITSPDGGVLSESWCAHPATYDSIVALFLQFRSAILRGDRQRVAELIDFPLQVNGKGSFSVPGSTQLPALFERTFTPAVVEKIRQANPKLVFCRNGTQAMLGRGVLWADLRDGELRVAIVNQ